MSGEVGNATSHLFLHDLKLYATGTIVVMMCRMWDLNAPTGRYFITDFVVSVAKGIVMHCTARATVPHNFLRLKEGGVYSINFFVVLANKEEYRVRKDDTFMVDFASATSIRKYFIIFDGFIRCPFQLLDIENIQSTGNKYFIDVAGYVTNIGRMNHTITGSKNLDFYLPNQREELEDYDVEVELVNAYV